jgi:SAM-dependent methyltransferase
MRLADDPGGRRARSFEGVADAYALARPGYPAAAIRWLLGPDPLDVADVGAGTGKLTAALLDAGHRPIAIEPLRAMRDTFAASLPGVPVLEGRAEALPLPDSRVDAVAAGQAFHWFDVNSAITESARVLRPGGMLGLIWNFRATSSAWMREVAALLGQDGLPEGGMRRLECLAGVADVERRDFQLVHPVDRETFVGLVSTWSVVAVLDKPEREELLGRVRALWDRHHEDVPGTRVSMLYTTEAYRVRLV